MLGAGNLLHVGAAATHAALVRDAPRAGTLHLATHGVLDPRRPENSYLTLAQKYRLSVPDAMTLDLKNANMVVLSACESGLGMQGLEYATLARAFMLAGAETVVASLWQVPSAPTDRLMRAFYQAIEKGESRVFALTAAKREFLARATQAERDPHFWAGFILFGGN